MVLSPHRGILHRKMLVLSNPLNFTFFSCLKSRYLIHANCANSICFRETGQIAAFFYVGGGGGGSGDRMF